MAEVVAVDGVWLLREGEYAVVRVEIDGLWTEIMREHIDGPFSHICEPNGIRAKVSEATDSSKAIGWGRGMFIAGAAAGVTPHRKRR